jgi:hypothetical protein
MGMVRLFVVQDNRRTFVDVPYGQHLETQADLEMSGANVYHAALLSAPPKSRNWRNGARLNQRLY